MHTTFSDGITPPEELLELVRRTKLKAFAVTDHDTLEGYLAVSQLLTDDDPELLSGIELSVSTADGDLHLLAYLIDPQHTGFKQALDDFRRRRVDRGREMVARLNQLGVELDYADVAAHVSGDVVGRPHVARALFARGSVSHYEQAFSKYIGTGKPAYVPKTNFSMSDAISLVHDAGGLAVLAHPCLDDRVKYLPELVELGLDGVETYHPAHTRSDSDRLKHLAEKHRLLYTGGSDFHGMPERYGTIGSQKVPFEVVERLQAAKR